MTLPPEGGAWRTVVVHDRHHVAAALTAAARLGVPVRLRSAPGAAAYLGAAVFHAMVKDTAAVVPKARYTAVLDCGDKPGLAMNALRHGIAAIRLEAPAAVRSRVADMAAKSDARLESDDGRTLDLQDVEDPLAACRAWLQSAAQQNVEGA